MKCNPAPSETFSFASKITESNREICKNRLFPIMNNINWLYVKMVDKVTNGM